MNIVVIGAGIFGTSVAIKLSETHNVTLIESNSDIMLNASKCNHNRLHYGFHYPRSYDTAKQSLDGYESFFNTFKDSISNNFPNYYMIEKNSKVTGSEYISFCDSLGLEYTEEYPDINIDLSNIVGSFKTNEPIYDYVGVKSKITRMLNNSKVNLILNKTINNSGDLEQYDVIINTTYSNINKIKSIFDIVPIKLNIQDVIIPIFRKKMDKIGLTIMDGDFCSVLPKGFDENTFLLYHVKYSVINKINDYYTPIGWGNDDFIKESINKIYKESSKYFSFLDDYEHIDYWRTIRALPINDNDSRTSDIFMDIANNKKIITLISGKITTCLDTADKIKKLI
jgi:hypothetical protein